MKQFVVTIGYSEYAISAEDALALLQIASRAKRLTGDKWNEPRELDAEQEPFVTGAALAEIVSPAKEADAKHDAFTSATRDVARG